MRRTLLGLVVMSCPIAAVSASASDFRSRTIRCLGSEEQVYLSYSSDRSPDKAKALPAVMLLHGAGDQASHMMDAWKRLADKEKLVLLAPELARDHCACA